MRAAAHYPIARIQSHEQPLRARSWQAHAQLSTTLPRSMASSKMFDELQQSSKCPPPKSPSGSWAPRGLQHVPQAASYLQYRTWERSAPSLTKNQTSRKLKRCKNTTRLRHAWHIPQKAKGGTDNLKQRGTDETELNALLMHMQLGTTADRFHARYHM